MKLLSGLRAGMKFVTPQQYTVSNQSHFIINTKTINQLVTFFPPLSGTEKVLDFGCGTGETTLAMAEGRFGELGNPGSVLGIDISQDMIEYCKSKYNLEKLDFVQLDTETNQMKAFCNKYTGTFDLVTSFNCLHWVTNQPDTVSFFNSILKKNGLFIFLVVSSQSIKNNPHRSTFEEMKKEGDWAKILKNTSWPCHNVLQENSDWMNNRDTDGSGPILEKDYVNLMEEHGFKVHMSQTLTVEYILSREFVDNYFKTHVLTGFKNIQDDKRELFLTEYKRRTENKNTLKEINYPMEVFQILGQKVEEL